MENRKDIGKAINDKLSLLDKTPTKKVWTGINEELQKKKKRRIGFFFFWGKTIGLLLVAIMAGLYFYHQNNGFNLGSSTNSKDTITVNNVNGKTVSSNPNTKNSGSKSTEANVNSSFAVDHKNSIESNSSISNKNNSDSKNDKKIENTVNRKTKNASTKANRKSSSSNTVSSKSGKGRSTLLSKVNTKKSERKPSKKLKKKTKKVKADLNSPETKITQSDTQIVDLSLLQNKTSGELTSDVKTKKTDSIAKKDKEKTMSINMYQKDSIKKDSAKIYNKFDVDVFISPILYGYFGNESTLDRRLDSLPKKSEIKFGYGVGLTYDLSEKISFRIGYSKVSVNYSTKNAPIDVSNYSGIDYNPNVSNQSIINSDNFPVNGSAIVDIIQKISYTEIPFEFKYKFLDKKIGLKSSFGFSYLLLNENKVSIKTANGFSQDIGKTKGISQTSLSLNLGVELDYPLFKNMKIFAEPIFSYQIKAFSDSTFKPYFFGIHTGIRYSLNNK